MSDLTLPEQMLPEPLGRDLWIVWTALASVMLHAGVLAVLLWQPLPKSAEAAQPPAIDVELVPPPESGARELPASEEPAEEKPPAESAAAEAPTETTSEEPSPPEQAAVPAPSPAAPAEAAAAETPPEAEATAKVAPIPLARPRVKGLTAPSDAPDEVASAPTPDTGGTGEIAEGTIVAAVPEEPDVATLELGPPRSAERFYLEAMLSTPSLAPAREMLGTLPPEKRMAQTCNIEALAQVGNAGEGFAPDVVMAEAYARQEMAGTRLVANGAIFRSGERWYGLAFDCTLSDDFTRVTAFSYRLGADVTEAVLARLDKN